MIKIGDTAVSEQKIVETAPLDSKKEKEDSDKKSTSAKKANQLTNPEELQEQNL